MPTTEVSLVTTHVYLNSLRTLKFWEWVGSQLLVKILETNVELNRVRAKMEPSCPECEETEGECV